MMRTRILGPRVIPQWGADLVPTIPFRQVGSMPKTRHLPAACLGGDAALKVSSEEDFAALHDCGRFGGAPTVNIIAGPDVTSPSAHSITTLWPCVNQHPA